MKNKRSISWVIMIVWMAVIFTLSHQSGTSSGQLSGMVMDWLLSPFQLFAIDIGDVAVFHFFIRKLSHFFAYVVLGILTYRAIRNPKSHKRNVFLRALLVCIIFAISDECHQLFIDGRSAEVTDVFIDSFGALSGCLLMALINSKILT